MRPDLDQLLVVSHHLARGHNKGISFCVQILANPCTFFQNLAFFLPDSFQDLKQFLSHLVRFPFSYCDLQKLLDGLQRVILADGQSNVRFSSAVYHHPASICGYQACHDPLRKLDIF